MEIRFLGAHNAESKSTRLVSFLIDEILAVEAGCLASELTFEEQKNVKTILLSHGHYDHIRGIPAFAFNSRGNSSNRVAAVFATPQTIKILKSHLIDGVIYPEFTEHTSYLGKPTLELQPLRPYKSKDIEGYQVVALPVKHTIDAVGYAITSKDGKELFYTGDTGPGLSHLWEHISPQLLIADTTFPNRLEALAKDSGHLCPEFLKQDLYAFRNIKGYVPDVILIHLSPEFEPEIRSEAKAVAKELSISIKLASDIEIFHF